MPLIRILILFIAVSQISWSATAAQAPRHQMIVASHPLATDAGAQMLKRGGSAVDAAIAAQLVMGLVEPQSSGIGGGAFLLHWDKRRARVETYDGRETAPMDTTPDHFLKADGSQLGFIEAVVGGKSVGVPGAMAMLAMAHKEHGRLPWRELFAPAIKLAEAGFPVSKRLASAIAGDPMVLQIPVTAAYLRPNGVALAAGDVVINQPYADSLKLLRDQSAGALYKGPLAQAIVDAVQNAPTHRGSLSLRDMESYMPIKRAAVCGTYRAHRICSMGPPSSGAVTMLQVLSFLGRHKLSRLDPNGTAAVHLFGDANRLAFADRDTYLADPKWMKVAVRELLSAQYLQLRGRSIDARRAIVDVGPGTPGGVKPDRRSMLDYSRPSTAHVSVVDARGDAVALTTTVEGPFGSHLMAGGFILNNQLTDFVFDPHPNGVPALNAPGPGKRPLSSMTPTFVFGPNGRLKFVVGSPGGWRIIPYVTRTITALVDWNMDPASAIALPHVTGRNKFVELETGSFSEAVMADMKTLGHNVKSVEMVSGLNIIKVGPNGLEGAADPRREGAVWSE